MGKGVAAHLSHVEAKARIGKPLPVGHGGAGKTAAFGNEVRGSSIIVGAFAFGIIYFAVKVGGMVYLFRKNGVISRFGRIGFYAGGDGEIHGDQAVHQILAPLFVQTDEDFSGFFRMTLQ